MHRRDGCTGGCGSGGDARLGRGGEVGSADASQPRWVLVTTETGTGLDRVRPPGSIRS